MAKPDPVIVVGAGPVGLCLALPRRMLPSSGASPSDDAANPKKPAGAKP
jgi:threonine dehydrogenase-like Zn-dependent dehydrogenase